MCDKLGDMLKQFEMAEAGRYMMPSLPVIARLDGRAFHTFTRGMKRPYDEQMMECMEYTTNCLVDEFHADIGYTQSDEITLAWRDVTMFGGRYQKYHSVLAGFASAVFARVAESYFPEKDIVPCFDCRVFQVPNDGYVVDVLAWREEDAVKNSVQMACQSMYSHKELQGKGRREQMDLLHAKGVNWNDYPVHFKRGVYFQRKVVERPLTEEEWSRIPEKHRPACREALVKRGSVEMLDIPPIRQIPNPESIIFRPKEQP